MGTTARGSTSVDESAEIVIGDATSGADVSGERLRGSVARPSPSPRPVAPSEDGWSAAAVPDSLLDHTLRGMRERDRWLDRHFGDLGMSDLDRRPFWDEVWNPDPGTILRTRVRATASPDSAVLGIHEIRRLG